MKVMRKSLILERNSREYEKLLESDKQGEGGQLFETPEDRPSALRHTFAERDILVQVRHPYIVTMHGSFTTPSKLYLLFDFVNGGHLFFQLYKEGFFLESHARLFLAEIVLAIEHLHSLGIIHRDLKPENILLDSEGHVMVTDFGLAKAGLDGGGRTRSFCGTAEYMAPEQISKAEHGFPADWWAVGILFYEMLTQKTPFYARNRKKQDENILKGRLKFPPYITSEAQSLIKGLLNRDQNRRLGSGPNGVKDIKNHPFFIAKSLGADAIKWNRLEQRLVPSPFNPEVEDEFDTNNFNELWTNMDPTDSPADTPAVLSKLIDDPFAGYSWISQSLALHARQETPHGGKSNIDSQAQNKCQNTPLSSQWGF